jgi:hypothetical protein
LVFLLHHCPKYLGRTPLRIVPDSVAFTVLLGTLVQTQVRESSCDDKINNEDGDAAAVSWGGVLFFHGE